MYYVAMQKSFGQKMHQKRKDTLSIPSLLHSVPGHDDGNQKIIVTCQVKFTYKVSFLIRILHIDTDKITLVVDLCIFIRILV